MSRTTAHPLLSIRATLVLLLATIVGIGAGVLGFLSGQPWAASVLLFHTIVD
jgi:hypothetical protein